MTAAAVTRRKVPAATAGETTGNGAGGVRQRHRRAAATTPADAPVMTIVRATQWRYPLGPGPDAPIVSRRPPRGFRCLPLRTGNGHGPVHPVRRPCGARGRSHRRTSDLRDEEAWPDGRPQGNFPQALTHAAFVNAAVTFHQRSSEA
jgi:hypothetical protein